MRAPDLQRNGPLAGAWSLSTRQDGAKPAVGGVVRAWHMRIGPNVSNQESGVSTWLVNGPFHPLWTWWYVSAIRLVDVEGLPPPYKAYPGATHEFMIFALDPDHEVDIERLEEGEEHVHYLTPQDVSAQFDGLQDVDVERLVELAVRSIVDGHASPDSDFRAWWDQCIPNTVEHLRHEALGLGAPAGHDG